MGQKVSIIITCYNKRDYIGATLQSVAAQVWDEVEVIVVDDGSTDDSWAVINAYIPKLKRRGYDVIAVSQENAGVSGAVKIGLQKTTGDFVCIIDGDDTLHEEYASALATALIENPQVDWVAADFTDMPYIVSDNPYLKSEVNFEFNHMPIEKWLDARILKRTSDSVAAIAIRASYLRNHRIEENIITVPRYDHEQQIALSLMAAGGTAFHLKRGLYRYAESVNNSITFRYSRSRDEIGSFIDLYEKAMESTLHRYGALTPRRRKYIAVYRLIWSFLRNPHAKETDLISTFLRLNLHDPSIDFYTAQQAGFMALYYYVTSQLLSLTLSNPAIKPKGNGRIIAYGAFGKASKQIRTGLHNADIKPDEYWDRAAKPGDTIQGVPVCLPDFSALQEEDVLFILLKKTTTAQDVTELKRSLSAKGRIVYYYDVIEYLCRYFFMRSDEREPKIRSEKC